MPKTLAARGTHATWRDIPNLPMHAIPHTLLSKEISTTVCITKSLGNGKGANCVENIHILGKRWSHRGGKYGALLPLLP